MDREYHNEVSHVSRLFFLNDDCDFSVWHSIIDIPYNQQSFEDSLLKCEVRDPGIFVTTRFSQWTYDLTSNGNYKYRSYLQSVAIVQLHMGKFQHLKHQPPSKIY